MDEKEWVERKALVEEIREAQRRLESCDDIEWERNKPYFKGLAWAHRIVLDAPAADVVEVVHAHWIDRDEKTWCSNCDASNKQYKPPYCPHCGAKMDGGKHETD